MGFRLKQITLMAITPAYALIVQRIEQRFPKP